LDKYCSAPDCGVSCIASLNIPLAVSFTNPLEFERKYKAAKSQGVMEVDEPLIPTFNPKTGQFE